MISGGDQFKVLHERLLFTDATLFYDELSIHIQDMNTSKTLCNGTLTQKKRTIVTPKELRKFLESRYSLLLNSQNIS